jgi:hypothetical protein
MAASERSSSLLIKSANDPDCGEKFHGRESCADHGRESRYRQSHRIGTRAVWLQRRPPFSPEDVVLEFAALLKSYRITKVQGDRYAGEWPRERFREHGVTYEPAGKPKNDLYRDMLPAINSRQVDLLDDSRLIAQIVSLERRTARGGRDSIDHAPGAHDDLANAVAGVVAELTSNSLAYDETLSWVR